MPAPSRPTSKPVTLVQLSDFHLCLPASFGPGDLLNKRFYGRLSWSRRRSELDPEILLAMIEDIGRRQPDLVAVTGDLTHLGRRAELVTARELLEKLGPPDRVLVIPGNHDAYVPGAWEEGSSILGGYLAGTGEIRPDGTPCYPVTRTVGEVEVIGLDTAQPRPLWLATGRLGAAQLAELAGKLEESGRQGRARVILIHHPPIPGLAGWRRRLSDERELVRVLAERGAELVLFGHIHREVRTFLEAGRRVIPCFGVPAASSRGRSPRRRARYHLYRFSRNRDHTWLLDYLVRRWSRSRARFVDEVGGTCKFPGNFPGSVSVSVSGSGT